MVSATVRAMMYSTYTQVSLEIYISGGGPVSTVMKFLQIQCADELLLFLSLKFMCTHCAVLRLFFFLSVLNSMIQRRSNNIHVLHSWLVFSNIFCLLNKGLLFSTKIIIFCTRHRNARRSPVTLTSIARI